MIDRKNISTLCLIVIGLCLGSAAIRHAAISRRPSTQPVAIQPSTQPVAIQISNELRQSRRTPSRGQTVESSVVCD